ncbi:uncharacterized protein LOC124382935 [Silurus meridionalis]|uniref:uncharacterized protein LOC124382935 n=1 Tax=Silurus meridionalis TaxID=175797 RepID=UPI001EEB8363|nr:uncharacterized protein LOC124382935 [Silurus meridionalis]
MFLVQWPVPVIIQKSDLSASVLQGFSCSSTQTLPQKKAKDLVKACRPRAGRDKVVLTEAQSSVFLENSENLQLFNNPGISASVLEYYTTQLYIQNPDFSPLGHSGAGSKVPDISAATIQTLGSQCVGLTVGQINSAPPNVISGALSTLSIISGWDQGQVNALIQSIISSGFNINSASSLVSLGTLIGGVPSTAISIIPSSELLSLSQNPTFIANILSAPVILQQTFVQKVISVDQTSVIQNVPDALVMYIPLVLLTSLSSVEVSLINNKSWSHEQAMMFFGAVASACNNPEDLSASVLQGFSCSSTQTLPQKKAKDLVKACRPRAGRDKVVLTEAQLTCMYNYVKEDLVESFMDVPSDMLLYYSYETIQNVNCQSYFRALGRADFSVLSPVLDKTTILFNNAKDCLGISGVSLTRDQVEVLGNMACTLDSSYIQNSDPFILEKLKNCGDLSDSQVTAVQSLLLSGNTAYGNPSTWNEQTVEQLGILVVYFKSGLCDTIGFNVKRKLFSVLREQKIPLIKLRTFFTECNSESTTVSNITATTIADAAFPFGFNAIQFDLYLDITILQENLAAITEKVVDTSLQMVILNKLNQIFPSGLGDHVLQLLGSISRLATIDDISKWNITIIDTLSSLMDSNDGYWEPEKSKAVIMRYLSMGDHSLGSAEINVIGSYICTLDISVLENITPESLMMVPYPDLSSCSFEQKSTLYIIVKSSFSNLHSSAIKYYQLMIPYLGGAPVEDIQAFSTHSICMDITTFTSLSPAVLNALNVRTVQALMGVNVAGLKLFENSSVVQSWVSQQKQMDLDMLNLGIINNSIKNYTAIIATTTTISTSASDTTMKTATLNALLTTTTSHTSAGATVNTTVATNVVHTSNTSFTKNNEHATFFQNNSVITINTPATSNALLTTTASPSSRSEISTSAEANAIITASSNVDLTTTTSPNTSIKNSISAEAYLNTTALSNTVVTSETSHLPPPTASFDITYTQNNSGITVNIPATSNALHTTTASPNTSFEINTSAGGNVNITTNSNIVLTTTAAPSTSFDIHTSAGANVNTTVITNVVLTNNASSTANIDIKTSTQNNSGITVNTPATSNALLTTTASPPRGFEINTSVGANINTTAISNDLHTTTAFAATIFEINTSAGGNVNITASSNVNFTTTASPNTMFEINTSAEPNINMTAITNVVHTTNASPNTSFEISTSSGANDNTNITTNVDHTSNTSSPENNKITTSTQNNSGITVNTSATSNALLTTTASPTRGFEINTSAGANINTTAISNDLHTTTAFAATIFEINTSAGGNVNITASNNVNFTTTASPNTMFEINTSAEPNINMTANTNVVHTTNASPNTSFEISTSSGANDNTNITTNVDHTSNTSSPENNKITTSTQNNSVITVNTPATSNSLLTTTASPTKGFEINISAGANVNTTAITNVDLTTNASSNANININTSTENNSVVTVNISATSNALYATTASPNTSFKMNTSAGPNINITAITNVDLNTNATQKTSFEISTSSGTTVKTANSDIVLTTTAAPSTSFDISTSPGANVKMTAITNVDHTSNTSSTRTNIKTSTQNNSGITLNTPATSSALLTTTASPTKDFAINTSARANLNTIASTNVDLTSKTLTENFIFTTSFQNNSSSTVNMSATSSANFLSILSQTANFKMPITAENNFSVSISTAAPGNAINTTSTVPTSSVNITTSFVTVNPCQGVDSQAIKTMLLYGNASAILCNFSITDYACSLVSVLSTDDIAKLLICKFTDSIKYAQEVWKLFFHNLAVPLDEALDKVYNMNLSSAKPDPSILNALAEVIIKNFTTAQLKNVTFVTKWFQMRLRPLLSSVSTDFLSSLSFTKFSCETYQIVVEALSSQESLMTEEQKQLVFSSFIFPFLSKDGSPDPGCVSITSGSNDWLLKNLGSFFNYATLTELEILNANFSSVAVFGLLSIEQKAQFILQPDTGVLGNELVIREVFSSMIASFDLNQLSMFFTSFSQTAIQMNLTSIPSAISDSILNMTLNNLVPHFQRFRPEDFALWFQNYLSILLPGIGSNTLSIIPMTIGCDSYREIVKGLDNVYSDLSATQSNTVFNYIQDYLKYQSSQGLSCYGGGSFYMFLKQLLLSFGFPDLIDFLSLIPDDRQAELLSSISLEELSKFLNRPNTVVNGSELCTLLDNYNRTNQYLEMEPVLSSVLASQTLECVWPRALSASTQADVEQWFNVILVHYLPYLRSQLISSTQLSGASCLSYRKLVSILGDNFNFSAADFSPADVYSSIKVYLSSGDFSPRCYNSSDPFLNSTAWFADNIGFFITFITLSDLQTFISDKKIGLFLENSKNLQLFNNSKIAVSVTEYYTTRLYTQNPSFNPLRLPGILLCESPGSVFAPLGIEESQTILSSINKFCSKTNPEITATIVTKFSTLSATTIELLGRQSVGLTVGQISATSSNVIKSALPMLSSISGWDQGQANALIQSIIGSGFNISSSSSLLSLGTLIEGVTSATMFSIPSFELLTLSQNPTFINNIQSARVILQETYVQQIISVDQTKVIKNVPDALVMHIPLVLLSTVSSIEVSLINNKSWSHEQAMMLFGAVTSAIDNPDDLSASVLQGFSCSSVQTLPWQKIKDLVKACRPRSGRDKVSLKEAQLTCMYNIMKEDSLNFTDVPFDMLLYYSYDKVQHGHCRSYFAALGGADFSVPSTILNKPATLFNNARACLGISGMSLTRDQVDVLGNMACTLDSSYIQNSDPFILEKLKNCGDLSDSQIIAVQSLLLSGNTAYGNPIKWNVQTLQQLGILPLYFKSEFWGQFSTDIKRTFLKSFMPFLKNQKTPIHKLRKFFIECNFKVSRAHRAADCTSGSITPITIADSSFPVGYDTIQFDLCLNTTVLQENLAAITEKVVDTSFQTIILNKLNQIYPSGLNDSVLQLLGPTSRVATTDDINKWNIVIIDTLSSLMKSNNGNWAPGMSKAVIMRYLSMANHTLGTAEINAIGASICSLDVSLLENITAESLKKANTLDLSSCSIQQKSALYIISNSSFSRQPNTYQLMRPYMGGAPVQDLQSLSSKNVSMDITTFMNLNPAVIMAINVSTVQGLLGVNVADLKLFENSSVVRSWVAQQYQYELNTLNINLFGGKIPSESSQSTITTVTNSQTNQTTSANITAQASHAPTFHAGAWWFLILCAGILTFHMT